MPIGRFNVRSLLTNIADGATVKANSALNLRVETAIVCKACHSADYISTQPPGKGKAFWQAEVQKMIKVYKAQIAEGDAAVIADYLAATY